MARYVSFVVSALSASFGLRGVRYLLSESHVLITPLTVQVVHKKMTAVISSAEPSQSPR